MLAQIARTRAEYPNQFWILFGGSLVNSIGGGMVFPFFTLYLYQRLNVSMTLVGVLLSLWSVSALVGQLAGGAWADRFGRKGLMASSLALSAVSILGFAIVDSLISAAIVALFAGFTGALFQPARDAMVADLVEPSKRAQAYSLLRVVANLGIAIGPAIGGFLATQSYLFVFVADSVLTLVFFAMTILWMQETKPSAPSALEQPRERATLLTVWHDTRFIVFCLGAALVVVSGSQMMTVLPVYMKSQFALGESYFGWVMTTNAGMVVLLQYAITRAGARFARLPYAAVGALLYALGTASVGVGSAFAHFVLAMAVMTVGEMIFVPTATAITADLAPADMRGRYMGMLGLTWTVGFGVGPILGGWITDTIAARALWFPTSVAAILGAAVFLLIARYAPARPLTADR